jgi:hypothetical protein
MAAGNARASSGQYRGVAYEADILFAKPWDDQNGGFPEDKTIDAMRYMAQKAASLGQPIAINMSLGGHYGAHDGTSAQERVVDELAGEGVVFCIAAGNEGESFIHDQASAGGGSITYRIAEYEANPGSNNDFALMIIWVDGAASPGVSIQGPGIDEGPIASGQVVGGQTAAGYIVIDNASQGADPQNGDKLIVIQFDDREGTPPAVADWTITISGGVNQAHAWHVNGTMTAGFPDSDQSHSVAMPAGAAKAITVAAYKSRNSWPAQAGTVSYSGPWGEAPVGDHAPFSSIGPTRDGRQKPDIAAPGMAIVSCYSQDTDPPQSNQLLTPDGQYYATQGTSMASPFTCGVVALMLEKNGALTADQVKALLQQTAITDDFTGPTWNARFGAGKVDALAAVAAVSGGPDGADGDIDGDGRATVLDLILLVNHILDPVGSPLTGDARTAADVYPAPNGDGNLDAQDLARIVAFILGTDTPGLTRPAAPAIFTLGEPERDGLRWLVPVHIGGEAIAAGQFALTVDGAVWSAEELGGAWPASLGATAHAAGDQLRVLFYDLGGELPAGGISFQIPVSVTGPATCEPRLSGLLLAAAGGEAREVQIQHDLPGTSSFLAIAPNPAPGATTISFRTGRAATGTLEVYDLRGRRVRLLQQDAGSGGAIGWDGRDDGGRELPAGVYMVRLVTPRESVSQKVVLRR